MPSSADTRGDVQVRATFSLGLAGKQGVPGLVCQRHLVDLSLGRSLSWSLRPVLWSIGLRTGKGKAEDGFHPPGFSKFLPQIGKSQLLLRHQTGLGVGLGIEASPRLSVVALPAQGNFSECHLWSWLLSPRHHQSLRGSFPGASRS